MKRKSPKNEYKEIKIEAYSHAGKKRKNNPLVGLVSSQTDKLNVQHDVSAKIDLFKETCHKFLSKINDPKIVTERLKKDIIKLVIDEVVIEGESVKIFATIPLPNKIHEREMDKTDIPGTFNAGATLGPVNETNMARIWNKHKQSNTPLKRKVFVAMSGGVDSSVAAALLKKEGYKMVGVFMKNWSDPAWPCPWAEDRADAMRVCIKLGIPFETWDFTKEYKTKVVDYMIREYTSGRTPNPDVMCNREIKFGLFFDKAMQAGADYIATGHYVRKVKSKNEKVKSYALARARYLEKDQSYFLWTLKQNQIEKCLFPIGEIESKAEVRRIAAEFGLPVADKKDSQGICFMGPVDVQEFIKPYVKTAMGDIVTTGGQKIGTHTGLDFFTIGQRKGIGVGGTGPYYVAKKDYETNTLIVAPITDQTSLESNSLIANNVSFIHDSMRLLQQSHAKRDGSVKIQAVIRYRQEPVPVTLKRLANDRWLVAFDHPVRAISPGQSVVFYHGEELLGGGTIDSI